MAPMWWSKRERISFALFPLFFTFPKSSYFPFWFNFLWLFQYQNLTNLGLLAHENGAHYLSLFLLIVQNLFPKISPLTWVFSFLFGKFLCNQLLTSLYSLFTFKEIKSPHQWLWMTPTIAKGESKFNFFCCPDKP